MATPTQFAAVGRRKTSTARVYLRPGNGKIVINKRPMENYFSLAWRQKATQAPFAVTETSDQFDVVVNVKGGGLTGQAEAIRLGITMFDCYVSSLSCSQVSVVLEVSIATTEVSMAGYG